MISPKSLTNRRRRFPELKRACMNLRNLKRGKYASRMWTKKISNDLAITHLINEAIDFLQCSFEGATNVNNPVKGAKNRMIRALKNLQNHCIKCSHSQRSIPLSVIRQFGSAATYLYQTTRRTEIKWECDECWQRLGLCAHVIFD